MFRYYVHTRPLKAGLLPEMHRWLDMFLEGDALIQNQDFNSYLNHYIMNLKTGKRTKHRFKVWFNNDADAGHFLREWG